MNKLAAVFGVGGFLLVFGAVGGMDDPAQAQHFTEQVILAAVGVFWMIVGALIMDGKVEHE